jgi:hypothetical protein
MSQCFAKVQDTSMSLLHRSPQPTLLTQTTSSYMLVTPLLHTSFRRSAPSQILFCIICQFVTPYISQHCTFSCTVVISFKLVHAASLSSRWKFKPPVTNHWGQVAQSVQRLAPSWMVRGLNPGGGENFRTHPDQPWVHPASCTMGTGSFPGVKRPGHGADHTPPSSTEGTNGYSYTSIHTLGQFRPVKGLLCLFIINHY